MSPGSSRSSLYILCWNIPFIVIILLTGLKDAAAAPVPAPAPAPRGPIVTIPPGAGPENITVVDPTTQQPIPQFPATDGGAGILNPVLWAVFGGMVGMPMGVAGVRAGRVATGAGIGFTSVVSVWAAFVNALPMPLAATPNTADLILTIILIAGFFFFTFLGAFLRFLHPMGLCLLGATAGTSLVMRVLIFKKDLLLPLWLYPLDIVLLVVGALVGGGAILWRRRVMVIMGTSLISTFLLGVGVDLILNIKAPQEQGMSRGLRLLLDRNGAHLADILGTPYEPGMGTVVILGVSLGLVPVLAYAQHRVFPGEFEYELRRSGEREREGSVYMMREGVDWAGRPVFTGSTKSGVGRAERSRFST